MYRLDRATSKNDSASPWAIKKLVKGKSKNSIYGKRLMNEASILRRLQHPNIVGFRGCLLDATGKNCLAMEECTTSLGDLIEIRAANEEPPFAPKHILKVALDVSTALNYLHNEALLLHADIKSYNVLIKNDFDICKLCDFGVCIPLKVDGGADTAKLDAGRQYVGTQCWSAPEMLKMPQEITAKADIFSFGLVLWEMLALTIPPQLADENSASDLDESIEIPTRSTVRPDLPNFDFRDEYNHVLELFYCCTSESRKDRPPASDLVVIVSLIIENVKSDDLVK